jgi:hypothetical protein
MPSITEYFVHPLKRVNRQGDPVDLEWVLAGHTMQNVAFFVQEMLMCAANVDG